jgi:hypothetical protein
MASFGVTVTTNTTPAISITISGTTTYAQLKNSLGQFVYNIFFVYLFSSILNQIKGIFNYSKYDSSGNQNLQSILSVISPYQYQPSIYIDTSKKNLILDGRDYVRFNMLPNSNLAIKLYCDRFATTDILDSQTVNNFVEVQSNMNDTNYFDEYVDIL